MADSYGADVATDTACPAIVWTIAGSDSGGGAGIQADLATIQDLGCHGCSVITTVTAQNSVTVTLAEPVSATMLQAQLKTLLFDLPPQAIKIGLLANQSQLTLLADWITAFKIQYPFVSVVVDPVMVASSGAVLVADKNKAKSSLDFTPFKGLIELITPNVLELGRLTKMDVGTKTQFAAAALALSQSLDCSVLAKGGDVGFGSAVIVDDTLTNAHRVNNNDWDLEFAEDYLVCRQVSSSSKLHQNGCFWLSSPRVNTCHNHGSGCTLSSAIAAVLAQGFVLQDAVVVAKAYVSQGLSAAIGLGQGPGPLARTGWPNDLSRYAKISQLDTITPLGLGRFKPLDADLGIYPVVNNLSMLESLLASGVKTVQLRIKSSTTELETQIKTAIALSNHFNAQLFINDHWQLAIKHHAFGVHLGQEDLIFADLTAIQAAGLALGISSHSYFELLLAHFYSPSYIALGHIFPTTTKQMPSAPQGLVKLKRYVALLKDYYPLVAIGGIDLNNLPSVKATGVSNIAVVRAITEAPEPTAAFAQLSQAWNGTKI